MFKPKYGFEKYRKEELKMEKTYYLAE